MLAGAIHSLIARRFGFGQTIYVVSSCATLREARLEFRVKIFAAETQQSVSPRAAPLFRRSQRELSLCRSYYLGRRELEREREAFRAEGVLLVVWARVYAVEGS
jgi:hypothetical protein